MSDEQPPAKGGTANLTAPRFEPGKSGNPGGRPKDLPKFREACRELSWVGLDVIKAGLSDPDVPFGEKVNAFKALTSKGGYLDLDRQASIETSQARVLMAMAAFNQLTPEERQRMLDAMERGFLGESVAP